MRQAITERMKVQCLLDRAALAGHPHICGICKNWIWPRDTIDFDHVHAVTASGPHEYQNLRPLHRDCHKGKSAADVAMNAKAKRIEKQRLGTANPKRGRKMKSRGFRKDIRRKFDGTVERRT